MKRIGLERIYIWGLLTVLFGVVLHAPLTVWLGVSFPEQSIFIKAWKEVVLALLGIIAVVIATRRDMWRTLLNDWLIRLSLGFLLLHIVLAVLLGGDSTSIAAGLMIDVRFIVIFLLAYLLASINPHALRQIIITVFVGAAIVLGFGVLQITVLPDGVLKGLGYSVETITPYTTIDSNPEYVRINSTLRGPNPLGALAVVYGALAVAYLAKYHASSSVRRKIAMITVAVASIAVLFASYSRSAYVAMALAIVTLLGLTAQLSKRVGLILVGVVAVAALGLSLVSTTDWYSNVILHEDPESTVVSKSNDDHVSSLQTGLERTISQPLGAGVGSTGSASLYDDTKANDIVIENHYFFVAHEAGWLGLGLFLALFGLLIFRLWKRRANWVVLGVLASGVGLAAIGVLLPVWADETVALTWWALAGASIAPISGIIKGRHDTRTRK